MTRACPDCLDVVVGGALSCPSCVPRKDGWLAAIRAPHATRPGWFGRFLGRHLVTPRCPTHRIAMNEHCSCGTIAYPVPAELSHVVLAGPPGCGKTCLLLGFLASTVGDGHSWVPIGARRAVARAAALRSGEKPPLTRAGHELPLLLDVFAEEHRRRAVVATSDIAGESWDGTPASSLARKLLDRATAALFVIDGGGLAVDLGLPGTDAWEPVRGPRLGANDECIGIAALAGALGGRAPITQLGIVVSKADRMGGIIGPADRVGSSARDLATLLEDRRRVVLARARDAFRCVEIVGATSALGFTPGPDDLAADGGLSRGIQPWGLEAVIAFAAKRPRGGSPWA